ncbi:MYB DNA-binding domain protein [Aspergillus lucknowensis]|uniref:Uncharacterized protein n=1 Tax=Aspergillus lucknowensis TaxID=176173 RepID=A0ABR4LW13_9EURO
MGQGSSQPASGVQNEEPPDDTETRTTRSPPNRPMAVKDAEGGAQNVGVTTAKRKRKSSTIGSNPSPGQSASHSSPEIKRKRLVDSLGKSDTLKVDDGAKREVTEPRSFPLNVGAANQTPKAKSRPSSVRPPKRAKSLAANDGHKMSLSPPLSTGDWQAKGRLGRTDGSSNAKGTTGAFKPEEVGALENYKVNFCNSNNCPTNVFDRMVQHGRAGPFPGEQWIKKKIFWKEVGTILPGRDRRSVYRFMKRHFQASGQQPHKWTDEQEDELAQLVRQHGSRFAYIAEILGRSNDDVVQRWKNHLEHRDTMRTGAWSGEELKALHDALKLVWSRSKEQGYDVGGSVYEMDESLISWSRVSEAMQHRRSRQQCADKWRKIKARMVPGRSISRSNSRSVTPSSAAKRQSSKKYKSSVFVDSEAEESGGQEKSEDEAKRSPKTTHQAKRSKSRSTTSSSESRSGSVSGSEADSEAQSGSASKSDSSSTSESESESESSTVEGKPKSDLNSKPSSGDESSTSRQSIAKSRSRSQPSTQRSLKDISKSTQSEAQERKRASTSESDSSTDSDSDSDSSSGTSERSGSSQPAKHKISKVIRRSESTTDNSSDSSSEEESSSTDESESKSGSTQVPLRNMKRKHEDSSARDAKTKDDKRVKIKKEPSPTSSETSSSESDSESGSDSSSKSSSSESTSDSESSSESESEPSVGTELKAAPKDSRVLSKATSKIKAEPEVSDTDVLIKKESDASGKSDASDSSSESGDDSSDSSSGDSSSEESSGSDSSFDSDSD